MRINRLPFYLKAAALFLSLAAAGCGGGGTGTPGPDGTSGVSGFALITSHAGPSRGGDAPPAAVPYAGTTLAVEPSGGDSKIAQVKTDAKGAFSVSLNPGTYQLVPVLTDTEKLSSILAQPQTFNRHGTPVHNGLGFLQSGSSLSDGAASQGREKRLVEEYHALRDQEDGGTLSGAQAARLRQVEAELDTLEDQDPIEQEADRRLQKIGDNLDEVLTLLRGLPRKDSAGQAGAATGALGTGPEGPAY